jgi:penicillin-binding protein 1A
MMENVVNAGTPTHAIRIEAGYKGVGAGKTGTSNSFNDAWFGGFTTDMAAVIWFGMDNGNMTLGKGISGGNVVAPVWGAFMRDIYNARGKLPEPFDQTLPKTVRQGAVCRYTGKWPNPECDKPEGLTGTLIPDAIVVNGKRRSVGGEMCNCHHAESKSFLDLLQADHGLSNEEVGRESNKSYDLIEGDKLLKQLGGDLPLPEAPATANSGSTGANGKAAP